MNRFTSFLVLSIALMLPLSLSAQRGVKQFFNEQLDSIVARLHKPLDDKEYRTDPAFYRLFAPTLLYGNTVKRSMTDGLELPGKVTDSNMELCDRRSLVIDGMLLDVYKNYPELVKMTEEDMRKEVTASDFNSMMKVPEIKIKDEASVVAPKNVEEALEVRKVKPNYWRSSGSFSFDFTQNYISGNWAQGGENNKTLITNLILKLNYNDKKKISFENSFEIKLGFVTTSGDTLHSYRTNNDMLRLKSRFGYKMIKNVDLTVDMECKTQSMPNYPTNKNDFISNFMAPFDASFSLGLNYKRSGKKWNLSVFFAPLSSYNYKFVRYGYLASRYGIRQGRQHKEDFGTQVKPSFSATLFKNVKYTTNMEFYTTYSRAYFNWENTFTMNINKYLKTTLFLHGRFDDSARRLYSDSYGYWQLKEYMSLGLTYSW